MSRPNKLLILVVMAIVLLGHNMAFALNVCKQGNWTIYESIDPMSDSKKVGMILHSDNKGSWGTYALVIRCQQGQTELYIRWNDRITEENPGVTIRLDKRSPMISNWSISSDRTITFYTSGDITDFIKQLMGAETLAARVTPYQGAPITAVFDVRGLSEAIKPLRECCHW